MSPLRGLRTNCILAPLAAAFIGALAVIAVGAWQADAALEADLLAHRDALAGLARLAEAGAAPPLAAWQAAHPGWDGLGRYALDGDRLDLLESAGDAPLGREPDPDLILGFQAARAWSDGGIALAAAPAPGADGRTCVLAGGWRPPGRASPWPFLSLAGAVLAIGGALGVYLVRRVYRPVQWLERAARAAACGAPEPGGRIDSEETASFRTSISTIIQHRGGDDGSHA